jgi:hypothetical protein
MEGGREAVQVKRLISERIRKNARGIDFAADVNAEISVNIAEGRETRGTRSTSTDRPDSKGAAGRTERAKEEQ